ncbi:hypothetical protein [Pseudoponticoccus marisrubri]|uniref:hypothetical protein n=1 Tax=Pseudoponticoccus marisrubri TaxID=1685382 RepID=UPI0012FDFF0E|nr:hypothetical protein [Pseudoponticoccus marisrubri]
MAHNTPQIGTITYNAAEACFEALVTLHTATGLQRIAASCDAPLTASEDRIENALWADALARADDPAVLRSQIETVELPQAA